MGFICSDLTEDGYIHMYLGSLEFLKKEKRKRDTHILECMKAASDVSCLMHHWCLFHNDIYNWIAPEQTCQIYINI